MLTVRIRPPTTATDNPEIITTRIDFRSAQAPPTMPNRKPVRYGIVEIMENSVTLKPTSGPIIREPIPMVMRIATCNPQCTRKARARMTQR